MSFRQVLAVAMLLAVGVAYAQATDPQAEPVLHEEQQEAAEHDTVAVSAATATDDSEQDSAAQATPPADAEPWLDAEAAPPEAAEAVNATEKTQTTAAAASAPQLLIGDADAGAGKAAVCAACHGQNGNASIPMYPKMAGQNEAYIVRQLQLYQSGERSDPIMTAFAAPLSPQDMHDLGAFFALQAAEAGVADDAVVERGRLLYHGGDAKLNVPACMACHGPDGGGMAGSGYPHLAGQWADYSAKVLHHWKDGSTWGDSPNARIMPEIVARLSDDDIAALASYMEGLHTTQPGTR